jgi:hypothetical protein
MGCISNTKVALGRDDEPDRPLPLSNERLGCGGRQPCSLEHVDTAVAVEVPRDDALSHLDEHGPFLFGQIFECGAMGCAGRCLDLRQESPPGSGQFAKPRAAIVLIHRPFDETARGQPFDRAGRGRTIERNIGRQSRLISRFARRERREQAVLQRGNSKPSASLLKQCDMNLVEPTYQKAGPLRQRPRTIFRFTAFHSRLTQRNPLDS